MDLSRKQDLRDLIATARSSMDYTIHLAEALSDVLDEYEVAVDMLRDVYLTGADVMSVELERFFEKEEF